MTEPQPQPAPVHAGRRLDWFPQFDEASRAYAVAPGVDQLPATGRLWAHGRVLDQGQEGACCGFAAAAEAAAEPVPVPRVTNRYARGWYLNAQRRDEWPGERYDGTSVLGTMKEGKARGLYGRYGWHFTVEQLAHGIVRDEDEDGGPAVIGVPWTEGGYETDELGVMRPAGDVVGGHALCVLGFVPDSDEDAALWAELERLELEEAVRSVIAEEPGAFILQNSWGESYGRGGLCVVPHSVVAQWFRERGEFAQPQQRQLPARRKGDTVTEVHVPEDDSPDELEDEQPERGDVTLHISAVEVQEGDRILDPPDELEQESVTVRGTPRQVRAWGGRRVVIDSTAGVFQLGAADPVTVRRMQGGE